MEPPKQAQPELPSQNVGPEDFDQYTQTLSKRFFHPEFKVEEVSDLIRQIVTEKRDMHQSLAR